MAKTLFDDLQQTAEGAALRLPSALTAAALCSYDFSKKTPALSMPLRIDGSAVEQCDSVGIAALVWLLQCCLRAGQMPQFVHLPDAVLPLLDLYKLHNRNLICNAGTTD